MYKLASRQPPGGRVQPGAYVRHCGQEHGGVMASVDSTDNYIAEIEALIEALWQQSGRAAGSASSWMQRLPSHDM
eukprot:4319234-Prymnesium_polylepis.1